MLLNSLRRILDKDILLKKLKTQWIEHQRKERGLVSTEIDFDTETLDVLSEQSQNLYMIFDWTNLSLHYLGKNIEDKFGYSIEEFEKDKFKMMFKILKLEHCLYWFRFLLWDKAANLVLTQEMRLENYSFVLCGLTFKHKDGHDVKTMIRSYCLKVNEKGFPIYGIFELSVVNHLLKSDDYWLLISAGKTNRKELAFFSNEIISKGSYLISPRELEVLKLIEKGLSSKEIAAFLFLSVDTIDKHRKNMLRRVGASDSNALIELCKRCSIL
jgi:DNA-binding CsgD family transcriptional regulator